MSMTELAVVISPTQFLWFMVVSTDWDHHPSFGCDTSSKLKPPFFGLPDC
jgi:hypothetical protein